MTDTLYCPIRKAWVSALPEERIRHSLVHHMVTQLRYPKGSMAVEIGLSQLPHLQAHLNLPQRRADIIVFGKNFHPQYSLFPLVLIECKAIDLTSSVIRQVIGYNQYVKAPFVAIANQTSLFTGYYHPALQDFKFYEGLPPYENLLQQAGQMTTLNPL